MLSRALGKADCKHFHTWMFHYMTMSILIEKDYFDWRQIIYDNIHNEN